MLKCIVLSLCIFLFHYKAIAIDCLNVEADTTSILSFQYQRLENYLIKYRSIQSAGGWGMIKPIKKVLKPGDTSQIIVGVRSHLHLIGDLSKDNKTNYFDSSLIKAIVSYQNRNGLKEDGKIDAILISQMNIPVGKLLKKIELNMKRIQQMDRASSDNFLLVNIPEFRLHVYEKNSSIYNMKVIIGQRHHKTVSFSGKIKYVVFCPYWNVPKSILNNELLPIIRRNPRYIASQNMEWNGGLLRQKPGPNNALGLIKFLFPNSHSIYMHDTPAKSLFSQHERTFSHGCIRLENARWLAGYLLRNDSGWTSDKIDKAITRRIEQYVPLKNPVPVYIVYLTAWVDESGRLHFRKDIYNKDV